jgi:hypothetical protein
MNKELENYIECLDRKHIGFKNHGKDVSQVSKKIKDSKHFHVAN